MWHIGPGLQVSIRGPLVAEENVPQVCFNLAQLQYIEIVPSYFRGSLQDAWLCVHVKGEGLGTRLAWLCSDPDSWKL